eukprot:7217304-Prymnesium_polylepis.1
MRARSSTSCARSSAASRSSRGSASQARSSRSSGGARSLAAERWPPPLRGRIARAARAPTPQSSCGSHPP